MRWKAGLWGLFLLAGCSTVHTAAPPEVEPLPPLVGWPQGAIALTIEDLRPTKDETEALVQTIEGTIRVWLRESTVPSDRYAMRIQILGYQAAAETGQPYWYGTTAFLVTVTDPTGNRVREWQILGRARKWNWWGYGTARAVAQESFQLAMAQLRARMEATPLVVLPTRGE